MHVATRLVCKKCQQCVSEQHIDPQIVEMEPEDVEQYKVAVLCDACDQSLRRRMRWLEIAVLAVLLGGVVFFVSSRWF